MVVIIYILNGSYLDIKQSLNEIVIKMSHTYLSDQLNFEPALPSTLCSKIEHSLCVFDRRYASSELMANKRYAIT